MRLVVLPSFELWSCYELFASRPGSSQVFTAAHSTWDITSEVKKFANPVERARHPTAIEPAIIRKTSAVDGDAAHSLLDSVARIQVPLMPANAHVGLDGITVEVTFGSFFTELRLRWWHAPPDGWEAVGRLADELRGLVLSSAG